MVNLQEIKEKIITELQPLYPDMHVSYSNDNTVHHVGPFKAMNDERDYYPYGERAYVGMVEAKISVHWGKFFDRIAGNGWMYGYDALFKFDLKDGDCKYYAEPTYIQESVVAWIAEMKQKAHNQD